jgi:catechol 2,3-dioxygenase-like lactoylglutathione lyase family enzyme
MAKFLHTMYRITDPERSRAFYEVLGMEFRRDLPIVHDGQLEATNYFFGYPGQDEELELTFNHDGRTYELAAATDTLRSASTISTLRACRPEDAGNRARARALPRPRGRLPAHVRTRSR